jgi:hypothetical protein
MNHFIHDWIKDENAKNWMNNIIEENFCFYNIDEYRLEDLFYRTKYIEILSIIFNRLSYNNFLFHDKKYQIPNFFINNQNTPSS